MTDPLRNPKDPLHKSGPDAERELFRAVGKLCHGYPADVVLGVAANLIVNTIRQGEPRRDGAREKFEHVITKARELLLGQHYDQSGARRNLFPFHQVIEVPLIQMRKKH